MIPKMNFQTEHNNQEKQFKAFCVAYDKVLVKYINALSDSVKEYYNVTKNNIRVLFRCLNYSKNITHQATMIVDKIENMNNKEGIAELFQAINMLNQNIKNFGINFNFNSKDASFFYNDMKILINQIKILRKKYLTEMNFRKDEKSATLYVPRKRDITNNNTLNICNTNENKQINNICNEILATIENFGNNLVYSLDIKKCYDEMTNSIKIKLDELASIPNNARNNINKLNSKRNQLFNIDTNLNYELGKINQNYKTYEIQISELQKQIKTNKNGTKNGKNINNNLNRINDNSYNISKDRKSEHNLNYIPSQKHSIKTNLNKGNNNEIMEYKNKLNCCQKRINYLIIELNKIKRENIEKQNIIQQYENKKNTKSERYLLGKENEINKVDVQNKGQYEETINGLREEILKYKNIIVMNKNKISQYEKQIRELRISRENTFSKNSFDNNKYRSYSANKNPPINKLLKKLEFKNSQILTLNNQIKTTKNERNELNISLQSYINRPSDNVIQQLSDVIIYLNKIIDGKDKIINQQNNLKMQNICDSNITQLTRK